MVTHIVVEKVPPGLTYFTLFFTAYTSTYILGLLYCPIVPI